MKYTGGRSYAYENDCTAYGHLRVEAVLPGGEQRAVLRLQQGLPPMTPSAQHAASVALLKMRTAHLLGELGGGEDVARGVARCCAELVFSRGLRAPPAPLSRAGGYTISAESVRQRARALCEAPPRSPGAGHDVGLGRIIALCYHSSILYI